MPKRFLSVFALLVLVSCGDSPSSGNATDTRGTDGSPQPNCSENLTACNGKCVDLTTSSNHCGECGRQCHDKTSCHTGICATDSLVAQAVKATNEARSKKQNCGQYGSFSPVPPLQFDDELYEAALMHANDMKKNDFFAHEGSDGSDFVARIGRTSYEGLPVAENIADNPYSPQRVIKSWINSDGHCKNIMLERANEIGIAYTEGGEYGKLWVQVFGRTR